MSKESEKDTEQYLIKSVEKKGGLCYKWTGTIGCPDRICIFPEEVIKYIFVETKSEGKPLDPAQKLRHRELHRSGVRVYTVDTKSAIDKLIENLYREVQFLTIRKEEKHVSRHIK